VVDTATPETDVSVGLTSAEVERSREEHGANRYTALPVPTWIDLVKEAVADPMLKILIVCAVVALVLGIVSGHTGELIDGVAIMFAVIIVTGVGVLNQLRAQRDYSALEAVASQELVRVIRDSEVHEIDTEELVRGDVLEINTGDVVPADSVFARGSDLLVNEAAITGEPDTGKAVGDELFGSSRILDGSGRAVVTAVGDNSVFGKVRREVGERDKTTPLQERLEVLAGQIGKGGTYAAGLTFLALIISGIFRNEVAQLGFNADTLEFVLGAVTIAITIIVVAVPEGLPLAVTLSLAYTTRKMAADQALVRELAACETMGAATIVCSDKTGTLTSGHMTLHSGEIGGRAYDAEALNSSTSADQFTGTYGDLIRAISVNSSADLVERDGEIVVAGNSTEGALLRWIDDHGVRYHVLRDQADIVGRVEFNSARKYMMTAIAVPEGVRVYVKGAPEIVAGLCSELGTADGSAEMTDGRRDEIITAVRGHATRGNRTLGFASGLKPAGTEGEDLLAGLTFDALFVIADPIRPEVPAAVERCNRAGVKIMIITGDIKETGAEIGRQAGVVSGDDDIVMEGTEFRAMSDEDVIGQLGRIRVLARALPDDKKRMVELLQSQGEVVSVTGDGVNDAPALVTADVGFAMGSGSKVAREASDIVIVDDNFVSLVRAIRWGRSVFENIRKFLQFQLTVNVAALTTAFVAAVLGKGTPLTAVQLLWVNLIMDSLAALALALEPPRDELFDQPPHGRDAPLISSSMWAHVLVLGTFMFAVLMLVLNTDLLIDPAEAVRHAMETIQGIENPSETEVENATNIYRYTLLFNVFVWFQIWNEFNCRSVRFHRNPFRGLAESRTFLAIVAVIVVLQVLLIQFGGAVFSTVPLSLRDWLVSVGIGASALVVGALVRIVGRSVSSDPYA
jgi:P-type Ca2+ transporter type 2C